MSGYERTEYAVILIFLSICGELARLLYMKEQMAARVSNIFAKCFIAAFSGIMVFLVSENFNFDTNLACVAAAMCGWAGPQILDVFAGVALNKARNKL